MTARAGAPAVEPEMPALLRAVLDELSLTERPRRAVWQNEAGGVTWAIGDVRRFRGAGDEGDRCGCGGRDQDVADPWFFAKWNSRDSGESLAAEYERLRWLQGRHPVPEAVHYAAGDSEEVLLTRALPGVPAIGERWARDPDAALRALGSGLRRLHEIPIDDCPYEWAVHARLGAAGCDPHLFDPIPPIDRLVLCQGDPCAPNTLIDARGAFAGHVDLGRLGVADRWADLAVMTMSLAWNFERYDERVFWEAYGARPDPERIAFYRRLWDAT